MVPARTMLETTLIKMEQKNNRELKQLYDAAGVGRLQLRERRDLRVALMADAADSWMAENSDFQLSRGDSIKEAFDAGEGDTPILDFWRDLIESGKLNEFIKWLFEALPGLIAAIVAIF